MTEDPYSSQPSVIKPTSQEDVTQLLRAWSAGDEAALDRLAPLVHAELVRLARIFMAREQPEHTLETGALVNEAFLRLVDWKNADWQNRAHFFAVSAKLMRRILVDFARSRETQKRGGGTFAVTLDGAPALSPERSADFIALDEALERLSAIDERRSRIVELRFFGGLSVEETAHVMGISRVTVQRDWKLAKAWLYREIRNRKS
jgi:RNA polymerase sigma factor (TIGR02999 family)